jgi:hypothetical protein
VSNDLLTDKCATSLRCKVTSASTTTSEIARPLSVFYRGNVGSDKDILIRMVLYAPSTKRVYLSLRAFVIWLLI